LRSEDIYVDSVAVVKYSEELDKSLREGLDLLGGFGPLRSPVLVKPNICTISDNTGFSVTDVKVVEALIDLVLEEDSSLVVKIIESDSQSKFAEKAFKKFGYQSLIEKMQFAGYDVSLANLSRSPTVQVPYNGLHFEDPELPEELVNPGYSISVAVAKSHYLTFITGVLKNQFGYLPRKDQGVYHSKITDVIVDLNRLIPPNFCVVDARVGIEGWNGPKIKKLDTFILGYRPVSVDATLARIMGYDPEKIRHIVEANKYNLGALNPTIKGKPLETVIEKFSPPKDLDPKALVR
jgi:uncharacterized protein (DUF362 family)